MLLQHQVDEGKHHAMNHSLRANKLKPSQITVKLKLVKSTLVATFDLQIGPAAIWTTTHGHFRSAQTA